MKYIVVILLALIFGFVGGFTSTALMLRGTKVLRAGQFVVVDESGRPRAVMGLLPKPGEVPGCQICDGQAHMIVLDQPGGRPAIWPTTGPQLSNQQLMELLKFGFMFLK